MWGHEHECLVEAQESTEHPFHITQPGSTVPTSLIEERALHPTHPGHSCPAIEVRMRAAHSASAVGMQRRNFAACERRTQWAEAKQKHVALLEIKGESHRLKPLPLKHVRPFIFDEINLEKERCDRAACCPALCGQRTIRGGECACDCERTHIRLLRCWAWRWAVGK